MTRTITSMKSTISLLASLFTPTLCLAIPVTPTTGASAGDLVSQFGIDTNPDISISSSSYSGGTLARATFTGGTGFLPFESGIILGSGNTAVNPGGPGYTNPGPGTTHFPAGADADLSAIVNPASTDDASVLEIEFTPSKAGSINFQYVFGSEEYEFTQGSRFDDVFALFLNDENIAVLPGTSTPITVINIDESTNSQYFSNDPTTGISHFVGKEAGFTLSATGDVLPNQLNTIKIAIADAQDEFTDSVVFLSGGTFTPDSISSNSIPEPSSSFLLGLGMLGMARRLRSRRRA